MLWPVTFSKVFMSTRAEAYAFKVPEGALVGAGLYRIPEDPAAAERNGGADPRRELREDLPRERWPGSHHRQELLTAAVWLYH